MEEFDALVNAANTFKRRNDIERWHDASANLYQMDKERGVAFVKDFRQAMTRLAKQGDPDAYDMARRSYLITAKDSFDDYMTILEWRREPEKRFWLPRRNVLLPVVNDIQALMDDRLDLLSISLPPGTGKSTLKIFLLSWLLGKSHDAPNLDSGHSGSMVQSTYDGVLSILTDAEEYCWGEIFPDHGDVITNAKELTIDVGKKHRFSTLTCRAIGASLTGATRCEGLLSADDLVSGIEEAVSIERLDKKWDAYNNDLKSRKKMGCKELHIATRWSVHDVIGRLKEQYAGDERAKFVVIPALNEDGESNFEYSYGVGFSTAYFLDMKNSLDDVSFKALFQNEPIEREGLLYDRDTLRRYYRLPDGEPDAVLAICDTAEGGGDDTFMPIGYVYGNDHYIADCVCSDALPDVTDALCVDMLLKHNPQTCQYESNSAGGRVADKVQDEVSRKGGRTRITKKWTSANKKTKIIVNSSWVKEHCLFLDDKIIEKGSMYAKMLNKLTSYTFAGKNAHDDVPDGMAQYALFAQNLDDGTVEVVKRMF